MIAKSSFKLGEVTYQFEVEEKDTKDTLLQIVVLSNPPRFCQVCKNADTKSQYKTLSANKDKDGNIYVKVFCPCGAQAGLGSYKSGGYFWHEFEAWTPKDKGEIK